MAAVREEDDRNPIDQGDESLGLKPLAQIGSLQTSAAARLLGVEPNTLREWGQRFGFPHAGVDADGRRQFASDEIRALRDELQVAASIAGAIGRARERLVAERASPDRAGS